VCNVLTYELEAGWKRLYKDLRGFLNEISGTDREKKTGVKWVG
jgi:hypothetical protein